MIRRSARARGERDRRVLAFGLFAVGAFLPIFAIVTGRPFGTTFLTLSVTALTAAGAALGSSGEGGNDVPTKQIRRKASRILKRVQAVVDEVDPPVDPPSHHRDLRRYLHLQQPLFGR